MFLAASCGMMSSFVYALVGQKADGRCSRFYPTQSDNQSLPTSLEAVNKRQDAGNDRTIDERSFQFQCGGKGRIGSRLHLVRMRPWVVAAPHCRVGALLFCGRSQ